MNLPTKIWCYQEKGKNYPQWRQHNEIPNFKPNQTDCASDETNESQKEKTSNVKVTIKKNIEIKKVNNDTKHSNKIIMLSPFISLSEILIQMISIFVEDFDR